MDKQEYLEKNLEFWQHLTAVQKTEISRNALIASHAKGDVIYSATQECLGAVLVQTGALRVFLLSDAGKEVTIMRLGAGEMCMLTASCIMRQINFDVHVEAETDCQLLTISAPCYAQLMRENMQVELYTLRGMADKFSDFMYTVEQILFLSVDARLAVFLLDEVARTHDPLLTITHEQIAKYIASAREVVTRTLKVFAKEGIVHLQRGTVQVLDKPRLRQIANGKNE